MAKQGSRSPVGPAPQTRRPLGRLFTIYPRPAGKVPAFCQWPWTASQPPHLHLGSFDPDEPGRVRGLVHRDIKPDNIILQPLDRMHLDTMTHTGDKTALASIRVKLLDFGLAKDVKVLSTIFSQTGQLLGTPAYISPEQCRGGDLDPRYCCALYKSGTDDYDAG